MVFDKKSVLSRRCKRNMFVERQKARMRERERERERERMRERERKRGRLGRDRVREKEFTQRSVYLCLSFNFIFRKRPIYFPSYRERRNLTPLGAPPLGRLVYTA